MDYTWAESGLTHGVQCLRLLIEALGAVVVGIGVARALVTAWQQRARQDLDTFASVRLCLARHLALALEFQLAADVLSTALSPSWGDLGQLAAVAGIRTALNHVLDAELRGLKHAVLPLQSVSTPLVNPPTSPQQA